MSEIIQIRNLKKTFASDKSTVIALDGVDLSIEEGEIFGIIGLSGAGKSTLVRCMNYLEKPTSGSVIFDGQDLGSMNEKELRKARRSIRILVAASISSEVLCLREAAKLVTVSIYSFADIPAV